MLLLKTVKQLNDYDQLQFAKQLTTKQIRIKQTNKQNQMKLNKSITKV